MDPQHNNVIRIPNRIPLFSLSPTLTVLFFSFLTAFLWTVLSFSSSKSKRQLQILEQKNKRLLLNNHLDQWKRTSMYFKENLKNKKVELFLTVFIFWLSCYIVQIFSLSFLKKERNMYYLYLFNSITIKSNLYVLVGV